MPGFTNRYIIMHGFTNRYASMTGLTNRYTSMTGWKRVSETGHKASQLSPTRVIAAGSEAVSEVDDSLHVQSPPPDTL